MNWSAYTTPQSALEPVRPAKCKFLPLTDWAWQVIMSTGEQDRATRKTSRNIPFHKTICKCSNKKNLTTKIHNFLANKYLGELERVLLVSENRPEWMASDIAIMSNKLICVPNYITYTSRDFEHILNDSQPVGLIVSNKNLLQTILV